MKKKNDVELTGVKEIARRANVSIATVDRVIHNRTGVSQATKDKINLIISELNYQPNLLAQRLASRKTIRIATLIPRRSKETSFWEAPLKGIEQADSEINQFGIMIDKYFYDLNDKSSFVEQSKVILQSKPDGVLLAPSFVEESVNFTNSCKELNIPYVLMDSDLPNQDSLTYIGPNLFRSGYLGAHLISYLTNENDRILIVNISKELDNHHHLLKKEQGLRAYFEDHNKPDTIIKLDIKQTDYKSIQKILSKEFEEYQDIKVVFVTNSRVSNVAHYIEESKKDVILIGYDFLEENIEYMNKGVIDFLICQKPMEQAYKGVMSLYQHLAFSSPVEKIYAALRKLTDANSIGEAVNLVEAKRGAVPAMLRAAVAETRASWDVADKYAIKERVSARLDRIELAAGRDINRGTGVLATIGSTAPFVGLFGTVWGIMNSFIGISEAQTTNLAIVAPGIAEALLATAFGLVAAIPAVMIYNHFARAIGGYKALVGDASVAVLCLLSRDFDRGVRPELRAAE